jgi:hypothetical protein
MRISGMIITCNKTTRNSRVFAKLKPRKGVARKRADHELRAQDERNEEERI